MSRDLKYLNTNRIIYRRDSEDKPTTIYEWGYYFENGTHGFYDLFRSKAKINSYKSLKWHLLTLWYLNPKLTMDEFKELSEVIAYEKNGFTTFKVPERILQNIIYEVYMEDLEKPPKNKLRKIIFKQMCGLSTSEKLSIVGQIIGRKKIHADDIYQCMIDINDLSEKITISKIAKLLKCSSRTIHRNMGEELKREKELLNRQNEKI
jgi:hypothetical protein